MQSPPRCSAEGNLPVSNHSLRDAVADADRGQCVSLGGDRSPEQVRHEKDPALGVRSGGGRPKASFHQ
eukprot:11842983-Alexandrium_andersonii.AAC.1